MKSLIKSRYEGDLVTDLSTDESTIPSQWTRPSFFEKHTLISWGKNYEKNESFIARIMYETHEKRQVWKRDFSI